MNTNEHAKFLETIAPIFVLFEINSTHPALTNLIETLYVYQIKLSDELKSRFSSIPWDDIPYLKAYIDISTEFGVMEELRKKTLINENFFNEYPLVATCLQQAEHNLLNFSYQKLTPYILAKVDNLNINAEDIKELLEDIRAAAESNDIRSYVLHALFPIESFNENELNDSVIQESLSKLISLENELSTDTKSKSFIYRLLDFSKLTSSFESIFSDKAGEHRLLKNKKRHLLHLQRINKKSSAPIQINEMKTDRMEGEVETSKQSSKHYLNLIKILTPTNKSVLNMSEKSRLMNHLHNICKINFEDSLLMAVVGISYFTGFPISKIIRTRFNSENFITKAGLFKKELPPLPISYRGSNDSRFVWLKLPKFLQEWFNLHDRKLYRVGTILKLSKYNEKKLHGKVCQFLKILRDRGQYRITISSIESSLSANTILFSRDPVLTTVLCGDIETSEPPVLCNYRAISSNEVENNYQLIVNKMMNESASKPESNSLAPPPPSIVLSFIENQKSNVKPHLKSKNPLERHNDLMFYTLTMMMFGSGHRPVTDPLCFLDDFVSDFSVVLINDKMVDSRHKYRVQAIPDICRTQLHGYIEHLKQLGNQLILLPSPKSKDLGHQILAMTEDRTKTIPLFFSIKSPEQSLSILPKDLLEYWKIFADVDKNVGRHVIATEMHRKDIDAGVIEIFLGHLEGHLHPWGNSSSRIPKEDLEFIGDSVNEIMLEMGWENIIPKKTTTALRTSRKTLINRHNEKKLGPNKRRSQREERKINAKDFLNETISEILGNNPTLTKELSIEIKDVYLRKVADRNDFSLKDANETIDRWIGKLQFDIHNIGLNYHPFIEKPPFNKQSIIDQNDRHRIATAMIEQLSTSRSYVLNEFSLIFKLVATASIFGGLSKIEHLLSLPRNVIENSYHFNKQIFIEFDGFRWYPDPRSACLVIRLKKSFNEYPKRLTENKIKKGLSELFEFIGETINRETILPWLSRLARTIQLSHFPGFVRTCWSGEVHFRKIPNTALSRLLANKRLKETEYAIEILNDTEDVSFNSFLLAPCFSNNTPEAESKIFTRKINDIIKQVKNVADKGNNNSNSQQRKRLRIALQEFESSASNLYPISRLVLAWLIDCCQNRENWKVSTIQRYTQEIAKPIIQIVQKNNPIEFSEDTFDAVYNECLEFGKNVDKEFRVSRLRNFHLFLVKNIAIESPDWSSLYTSAGSSNNPEIDSNLITVPEYDLAINLVLSDHSISNWYRNRIALILIFGYRFGLRISEANSRLLSEIQFNESFEQLSVTVKNNIYGGPKTKSGVRRVPCIGRLSPNEKLIISTVIQQTEQRVHEDPQVSLFFDDDSRHRIDLNFAGTYLNKLLKYVSGDPSIHYHHLRHSWATRLCAIAYEEELEQEFSHICKLLIGRIGTENIEQLWGGKNDLTPKFRAISVAMGHANLTTTASSYTHIIDILGASYVMSDTPSIQEISYLLNKPEETLYKRFQRRSNESFYTTFLQQEKVERIFPDFINNGNLLRLPDTWDGIGQPKKDIDVSLIDINNILLLSRRRHGDIKNLNRLPESLAIKIVELALELESESGYNYYAAIQNSDEFSVSESTESIDENTSENKRIHSLCLGMASHLNGLSNEKLQSLWLKGYYKKDPKWSFLRIKDLLTFIDELKLHGIDVLYRLTVPNDLKIDKSELTSHSIETVQYYDPSGSRNTSINPIYLKPSKIPLQFKSFSTINRMIFLMIIYFRLQSLQET